MVESHVTPAEWLISTWRPGILRTFTANIGMIWVELDLQWIWVICSRERIHYVHQSLVMGPLTLSHEGFVSFRMLCHCSQMFWWELQCRGQEAKKSVLIRTHNSCQALFVRFFACCRVLLFETVNKFVVLPCFVVIVFWYFVHITVVCCTSDLL